MEYHKGCGRTDAELILYEVADLAILALQHAASAYSSFEPTYLLQSGSGGSGWDSFGPGAKETRIYPRAYTRIYHSAL